MANGYCYGVIQVQTGASIRERLRLVCPMRVARLVHSVQCLCLALFVWAVLFALPAGAQTAQDSTRFGTATPTSPLSTPLNDLLARVQSLHRERQFKAALDLLEPRVGLYAGIPEFDYLLGIAALDAGQPGKAILALERVLLVSPNNLQARAEIARAYLATGETEAARRQFETVSSQQIPADVRRVIDVYLAGIARAESGASTRHLVFAELGLGWDTNVNFGSQSNQWLLSDGTAVTPLPVSRPQSSALLALSIAATGQKPMSGQFSLIYGGTLSIRSTPSAHTLDQTQMDLNAALRHKRNCHESLMQIQYQTLRLDDTTFRNALGLTGQWRCDVNAHTQLGAFVQTFDFGFPNQSVRDARRNTIGLTFSRLLDHPSQPIIVGSLYGGQERTRESIGALDHDFKGYRVSLNARLGDGWRGYGMLSYEARSFQAIEPIFGVVREDRQTEIRVGADKSLSRQWTLAPVVSVTRNSSTLAPNDFRRTQATLFARYRF